MGGILKPMHIEGKVDLKFTEPDGTVHTIEATDVTFKQNRDEVQSDIRAIRFEASTVIHMAADAMLTFVNACGDLFERARYAPNQGKKKPRGRKAKAFSKNVWKQYIILLTVAKMNRAANLAEVKARNPEALQLYLVRLTSYEGMGEMNMVVDDTKDGYPLDQAELIRQDYAARNPKGVYVLEELPK